MVKKLVKLKWGFLGVILFLLFFNCLYSQEMERDSLENIEEEILSFQDRENEIIAKGRKLILQNIKSGNLEKVIQIINYIDNNVDYNKNVAFWEEERYLIEYWTEVYDELLDPHVFESYLKYDFSRMRHPPKDLFFQELRDHSYKNVNLLFDKIIKSKLDNYEKDYLKLFLKYLLGPRNETAEDRKKFQEELNYDADDYLSYYKESQYHHLIHKYIRIKYVESIYGYGIDFNIGGNGLGGNIKKHFENMVLLGFGFDLIYKNFVGDIRFFVGAGGNTKIEFIHNGVWKKGLEMSVLDVEISGGPLLVETNWVNFFPFIGASYLYFSPPDNIRNQPGNDVKLDLFTGLMGVNFDLKIAKSTDLFPWIQSNSNWVLKLRAAYNEILTKNNNFAGNMIYITIGIGTIGRPLIRDY